MADSQKQYGARDGTGAAIEPFEGIFPLVKELEPGKVAVIGTGFYITRYGLFLTARHVLMDVVDAAGKPTHRLFALHYPRDVTEVYIRNVLTFNFSDQVDVALGQLDNFLEKVPKRPLANIRPTLTLKTPRRNSEVLTFAYPENEIIDFTDSSVPNHIAGNYFDGRFLRHVTDSRHPWFPHPHYETSIRIKNGASGGPVFDRWGRIFGINCAGMDFADGGHESRMIRIRECLCLSLNRMQIPTDSWEMAQIPENRRGSRLTVFDLSRFGHILFQPRLRQL